MKATLLKRPLFLATMALVLSSGPGVVPQASQVLERQAEITLPPTTVPAAFAISPDGKKLVSVGMSEGKSQLWLRPLDSNEPGRFLPGTEDVVFPILVWSPDSRFIGFVIGNQLKVVAVEKESIAEMGALPKPVGPKYIINSATWNRAGVILLGSPGGPIKGISVSDGSITTATPPLQNPRQTAHGFPYFLPDGSHFLYYVTGSKDDQGLWVGSLNNPSDTKRLIGGDAPMRAVYSRSGQILFIRNGTLFGQNFDPVRLQLSGSPFPVADHIIAVSTSAAGHLAYRSGLETGSDKEYSGKQFTWFTRSGEKAETVGTPVSVGFGAPSLSADGSRLAFDGTMEGKAGIWLMDTASGGLTLFNSEGSRPVWSPDGRRIAFTSDRTGGYMLYEQSTAPGAKDTLLFTPAAKTWRLPTDWSRDGRFLLYRRDSNNIEIMALQLAGSQSREIFVARGTRTCFCIQFSPDGNWVAYESTESGRDEIYIQSFPPGGRISTRISQEGGAWPRWRGDGKELYYVSPDGMLTAVSLDFPSAQTIRAVSSTPLFKPPMIVSGSPGYAQQYLPSPDGKKFLVVAIRPVELPARVIANWQGNAGAN